MADKDSSPKSSNEQMKHADMGVVNKDKSTFYHMVLKNMITQKVILNVPFLFHPRDIEWNQPFARVTLYHLNMEKMTDRQRQTFWHKVKKIAKDTLNEKRSNITAGLKKIFFGTYGDWLILMTIYYYNTYKHYSYSISIVTHNILYHY